MDGYHTLLSGRDWDVRFGTDGHMRRAGGVLQRGVAEEDRRVLNGRRTLLSGRYQISRFAPTLTYVGRDREPRKNGESVGWLRLAVTAIPASFLRHTRHLR